MILYGPKIQFKEIFCGQKSCPQKFLRTQNFSPQVLSASCVRKHFQTKFSVVFGKALPIREIYSDLPPECKTLNLETVESIPTVITVNGKQYNIKGQIQHGATSRVEFFF